MIRLFLQYSVLAVLCELLLACVVTWTKYCIYTGLFTYMVTKRYYNKLYKNSFISRCLFKYNYWRFDGLYDVILIRVCLCMLFLWFLHL